MPSNQEPKERLPTKIVHDLSSGGTTGLHFVVSTSTEKPNAELRKLIRRQVMLGKNIGKTAGRKRKVTKVVEEDDVGLDLESRLVKHPAFVPRKFGSVTSSVCFADHVEPGAVEVVLQLSSIAKQMLFPIETCIFFDRRAENWIAPLGYDPAYLHALIFTSQYYFDTLNTKRSEGALVNPRTLSHYLKTIKILRERMANEEDQARLSDSTLGAVMSLAVHAFMSRDMTSAKNHVEGLCKIVTLRGGVTTFKNNAKLLVEILRTDLGMALVDGSNPIFFNGESSEKSTPPYPDLTQLMKLQPEIRQISLTSLEDIDLELDETWRTLSDFTSIINFAASSGQKFTTENFLDTIVSTMYRLLSMKFKNGSCDEAIRLGLLAFCCTVFMQWQTLGLRYVHFTGQLRDCLQELVNRGNQEVDKRLSIWLLMIGGASVLEKSDEVWLIPALRSRVEECGINAWFQMEDLLKEFMWVELVHDKPGRILFRSVIAYLPV